MARDTIINVKVNTGNSAKDVKATEKAMDGFTQSLNDNTKAKTQSNQSNDKFQKDLDRINKEVNSGSLSVRELSKRLNEYQSIALQAGKDSPIGRQAIKDASVLNDRISDVRQSITTLADDGVKVRAALELGTVAVSGYQGFIGVTQLLGAENEDLLKVLTKLQAAQGVLNSLQAVQNALKKEGAIANVLFNKSIRGTITAMSGLQKAIIATGIGALVVAVGLLVANFDRLKSAVNGVTGEQEDYNKKTQERLEIAEQELNTIDEQTNQLKLQGLSQIDIIKLKKQAVQEAINEAEINLENQKQLRQTQIDASQRNKDILQGILKFLTLPTQILIDSFNKVANLLGFDGIDFNIAERVAGFIFDPEDVAQKGDEVIAEAEKKLNQLREQQAGFELTLQADRDEAFKKRLAKEEQQQKLLIELEEKLKDLRIANIKDENDQRIQALQLQQQRERQQLREKFGKNSELEKELIIRQQQEFDELINGIENERLDKEQERLIRDEKARLELQLLLQKESSEALNEAQIALWEFERDLLLANEDLTENERLKIKEEYRQKELELEQRTNDAIAKSDEELNAFRKNIAQKSFETLTFLASAFQKDSEEGQRRAFNIEKTAGIAQGLVSTYLSAQKAYASQLSLPTPDAPARAKLAAGSAIATGLANVAKISATRFQGGGSLGGNASSVGTLPSREEQNLGRDIQLFGSQNEGAEVLAGQQNQTFTIQAQVVETDMTATQNEVSDIEQLSQL
jgi:hypothetical protein